MSKEFDAGEIRRSIELESAKEVQDAAKRVLQALVFSTPVGNPALWGSPPPPGYVGGNARANWRVSDSDPGAPRPIDGAGVPAQATLSAGAAVIQLYGRDDFAREDSIFLYNAAPYIRRLNAGWSTQAPPMFVETAVEVGLRGGDGGSRELP